MTSDIGICKLEGDAGLRETAVRAERVAQAGGSSRVIIACIAIALVTGGVCALYFFPSLRSRPAMDDSGRAQNKTIAVLPFENLSDEPEGSVFADGVQDDVLTKLAKLSDLTVISRRSVMAYRGRQDLHKVGKALGVSQVLE